MKRIPTPIFKPKLDSKFGISIAHNQAVDAVKKCCCAEFNLRGLHCHIGSQILSWFNAKTVEVMVGLMAEAAKLGIRLSELIWAVWALSMCRIISRQSAPGDLLTESC